MSRFFDALKEASRSRSKPNESDGGENWEALVPDASDLLDARELLKEAIASAAVTAPVLAPEPERSEPPAVLHEELADLGAQPQHRPLAPKIQISFDPKARLI